MGEFNVCVGRRREGGRRRAWRGRRGRGRGGSRRREGDGEGVDGCLHGRQQAESAVGHAEAREGRQLGGTADNECDDLQDEENEEWDV